MNNDKDKYGTINFLDIDTESGKIISEESKSTTKKLPDIVIETEDNNSTPLTQEQEEFLTGTYHENEEKRQNERQKRENESKKRNFMIICAIIATFLLSVYSLFAVLHFNDLAKQKDIQERVIFLSDNATYNNNVRALFLNLKTNAVEYQAGTKTSFKFETKSKEIIKEIESQASSLKDNEKLFKKYKALDIYKNLEERLAQALALAEYQKGSSQIVDIIIKTNAYLTSEETNKSSYLTVLETYLNKYDIPYSYKEGKLNYQIN